MGIIRQSTLKSQKDCHSFCSSTVQRLNAKHTIETNITIINFNYWLAGVTDGDGCFWFGQNKNKSWDFSFKIAQSSYNSKMLAYIKKNLKIGSITYDKRSDSVQYRIRNTNSLKTIINIFDKYPLLSRKAFDFEIFKKALIIQEQNPANKDVLLWELKNTKIPDNYVNPTINSNINNSFIPHNQWITGFMEAEGSFYLTKKDQKRICHGIGITQKHDKYLLSYVKKALDINANVRWNKAGFWSLDSTSKKSILKAISFFHKKLRGMKSLEFKVWSSSYNKYKNDYQKLEQIREWIRNIKKIDPLRKRGDLKSPLFSKRIANGKKEKALLSLFNSLREPNLPINK